MTIVIVAFGLGIFVVQHKMIANSSPVYGNLQSKTDRHKPYNVKDSLLAIINVIEKQSPGGFYPMVRIDFPSVPGSTCECWCYESDGLEFVSYEKVFGGGVTLKHEYDGGTIITKVIPFRDKVEFVAHVENQTKEPSFLNMCWQLREGQNFKAVDEDHYSELIEREFIFMKDSGRVFLNQTTRRPKIGSDTSDWFNKPYSWIQIYKPDWKNLPEKGNPEYTECDGWSNCSTDRYSKTVVGAVSRDGAWLMAIAADSSALSLSNAWHDCMHVWAPWKNGIWREVIYAMENNPEKLLEKYETDFE